MKKIETIEEYKIIKAFISQLERKGLITMEEKLNALARMDEACVAEINKSYSKTF